MVAKLVGERPDIANLGKSVVATELQKIRLVDPSPSPVLSPTPPLLVQPLDCPPSPLMHTGCGRDLHPDFDLRETVEHWHWRMEDARRQAAIEAAKPVDAKPGGFGHRPRFQLRSATRNFEFDPTVYTAIRSGNCTTFKPTGSITLLPRCSHTTKVYGPEGPFPERAKAYRERQEIAEFTGEPMQYDSPIYTADLKPATPEPTPPTAEEVKAQKAAARKSRAIDRELALTRVICQPEWNGELTPAQRKKVLKGAKKKAKKSRSTKAPKIAKKPSRVTKAVTKSTRPRRKCRFDPGHFKE